MGVYKFRTEVDDKGKTIHHGICGHAYPGSGKRGRPPLTCPKCRKEAKEAARTERVEAKAARKTAAKAKAKGSAEALV